MRATAGETVSYVETVTQVNPFSELVALSVSRAPIGTTVTRRSRRVGASGRGPHHRRIK
jgi:hypothetical protein